MLLSFFSLTQKQQPLQGDFMIFGRIWKDDTLWGYLTPSRVMLSLYMWGFPCKRQECCKHSPIWNPIQSSKRSYIRRKPNKAFGFSRSLYVFSSWPSLFEIPFLIVLLTHFLQFFSLQQNAVQSVKTVQRKNQQ